MSLSDVAQTASIADRGLEAAVSLWRNLSLVSTLEVP